MGKKVKSFFQGIWGNTDVKYYPVILIVLSLLMAFFVPITVRALNEAPDSFIATPLDDAGEPTIEATVFTEEATVELVQYDNLFDTTNAFNSDVKVYAALAAPIAGESITFQSDLDITESDLAEGDVIRFTSGSTYWNYDPPTSLPAYIVSEVDYVNDTFRFLSGSSDIFNVTSDTARISKQDITVDTQTYFVDWSTPGNITANTPSDIYFGAPTISSLDVGSLVTFGGSDPITYEPCDGFYIVTAVDAFTNYTATVLGNKGCIVEPNGLVTVQKVTDPGVEMPNSFTLPAGVAITSANGSSITAEQKVGGSDYQLKSLSVDANGEIELKVASPTKGTIAIVPDPDQSLPGLSLEALVDYSLPGIDVVFPAEAATGVSGSTAVYFELDGSVGTTSFTNALDSIARVNSLTAEFQQVIVDGSWTESNNGLGTYYLDFFPTLELTDNDYEVCISEDYAKPGQYSTIQSFGGYYCSYFGVGAGGPISGGAGGGGGGTVGTIGVTSTFPSDGDTNVNAFSAPYFTLDSSPGIFGYDNTVETGASTFTVSLKDSTDTPVAGSWTESGSGSVYYLDFTPSAGSLDADTTYTACLNNTTSGLSCFTFTTEGSGGGAGGGSYGVLSTTPADLATDVSTSNLTEIYFEVDTPTLITNLTNTGSSTAYIIDSLSNPVSGVWSEIDDAGFYKLYFYPDADLDADTTYTMCLTGTFNGSDCATFTTGSGAGGGASYNVTGTFPANSATDIITNTGIYFTLDAQSNISNYDNNNENQASTVTVSLKDDQGTPVDGYWNEGGGGSTYYLDFFLNSGVTLAQGTTYTACLAGTGSGESCFSFTTESQTYIVSNSFPTDGAIDITTNTAPYFNVDADPGLTNYDNNSENQASTLVVSLKDGDDNPVDGYWTSNGSGNSYFIDFYFNGGGSLDEATSYTACLANTSTGELCNTFTTEGGYVVTSTFPENNSTDIGTITTIYFQVDNATGISNYDNGLENQASTQTVSLKDGAGVPVPGTWTETAFAPYYLDFTPEIGTELAENTTYTACLPGTNTGESCFSFTTEDNRPNINSFSLADGATDVSIYEYVYISLSGSTNNSLIENAVDSLVKITDDANNPVAGDWSEFYNGGTYEMSFSLDTQYDSATTYNMCISETIAKSASLTPANGYYCSSFTTEDTRPVVNSVTPSDNATNVNVYTIPMFEVSDSLGVSNDQNSTTSIVKIVDSEGYAPLGLWNEFYNGSGFEISFSLDPSEGFELPTQVTFDLCIDSSLAQSASLSESNGYYCSTFTTADSVIVVPTITSNSPANAAVNVDTVDPSVSFTLDSATGTFFLSNSAASVVRITDSSGVAAAGTWDEIQSGADYVVAFNPSADLAYDETYTACMEDSVGTSSSLTYSNGYYCFSFTTASEGVALPEVTSTSPVDSSTDVSVSSPVEVLVDSGTGYIGLNNTTSSTLSLTTNNGTIEVPGSWTEFDVGAGTYSITFSPIATVLDYQTEYQLCVDATAFTTGPGAVFTSTASEHCMTFTTESEPQPEIIGVNPGYEAPGFDPFVSPISFALDTEPSGMSYPVINTENSLFIVRENGVALTGEWYGAENTDLGIPYHEISFSLDSESIFSYDSPYELCIDSSLVETPSAALQFTESNGYHCITFSSSSEPVNLIAYHPPDGAVVPPFTFIEVAFSSPISSFPSNGITNDLTLAKNGTDFISGFWVPHEIYHTTNGAGVTNTGYFAYEFIPGTDLEPNTEYELCVSNTILTASNFIFTDLGEVEDKGGYSCSTFTVEDGEFGSFSYAGANDFSAIASASIPGGVVPPMSEMVFPSPGETEVPTNIECVIVDFDQPIDTSTLSGNVKVKEVSYSSSGNASYSTVGGVQVYPTAQEVVSTHDICIAGVSYKANTTYEIELTRDIQSVDGLRIAGMPDNGTFGFGFENQGSFKRQFSTGSGSVTEPLFVEYSNISDNQNSFPVYEEIRAFVNSPIDKETLDSSSVSVQIASNGFAINGEVFYDAPGKAIVFRPAAPLTASTAYNLVIADSVTNIYGQGLNGGLTQLFTTGAADSTAPKLSYVEADQSIIRLFFNKKMNIKTGSDSANSVLNSGNYIFKTCSGSWVSSDGTSCEGSGSPTTHNLFSYDLSWDRYEQSVVINGLDLEANDGWYLEMKSNVTDVVGNEANSSSLKHTGEVWSNANFFGGQGSATSVPFVDRNIKLFYEDPVYVEPDSRKAGVKTIYNIDIVLQNDLPAGGYLEFSFPPSTDISGLQAGPTTDFNGDFVSGKPTYDSLTNVPSKVSDGLYANDGVGIIEGARKAYVQVSHKIDAGERISFELLGGLTPTEPRDISNGYIIEVKSFNKNKQFLEEVEPAPFGIIASSTSGSYDISGKVVDQDGAALSGVQVFIGSPIHGEVIEFTDASGDFTFTNMDPGFYEVWTDDDVQVDSTMYFGRVKPLFVDLIEDDITLSNITLKEADSASGAPLSLTISGSLSNISTLGYGDSIDIFGRNIFTGEHYRQAVTRASVIGTHTFTLPEAGEYEIGIGPTLDGQPVPIDWIPPSNQFIVVTPADIISQIPKDITFNIERAAETLNGKVVDSDGTAIKNAKVTASRKLGNREVIANETLSLEDGTFSIPVKKGRWTVDVVADGYERPEPVGIHIKSNGKYLAATDDSFSTLTLEVKKDANKKSVSGRVADGDGNPISDAIVMARKSNGFQFVETKTGQDGLFVLNLDAGSYSLVVEYAPVYGSNFESKSITVSSADLSNQNFSPREASGSTGIATISGTVTTPDTDKSGIRVVAFNPTTFERFNTKTNTDGSYRIQNVPYDTGSGTAYVIEAHPDGYFGFEPIEKTVSSSTVTGQNFSISSPREVTFELATAIGEDVSIGIHGTGQAHDFDVIPSGQTSVDFKLPNGTYFVDIDAGPVKQDELTISGLGYSSATQTINVSADGTVNISLPTLYTVSGSVKVAGSAESDLWVSALNTTTNQTLGTFTGIEDGASDGEYTLDLPAGDYEITVKRPGYFSSGQKVTVAANTTGVDFNLTANGRTIAGTVKDTDGNTLEKALVVAEFFGASGSDVFTITTNSDGTYTLPVPSGKFRVYATTLGYADSDEIEVDTTSASATGKDFAISELSGDDALREAVAESFDPSSGTAFRDPNAGLTLNLGANVVSTSNNNYRITSSQNNKLPKSSGSSKVLTKFGQSLTITDANGQPVTKLASGKAEVKIEITKAKLLAVLEELGIDPSDLDKIDWTYQESSLGESALIEVPTVTAYYKADGTVTKNIDEANLVTYTLSTAHFTTFAPIIPSGATPPATPTGLAVTAGDTEATLTWNANGEGDMKEYDIWEANVTEGVVQTYSHANCAATCSVTITGLTNDVELAYQLIAVDNDDNESAGSTAVNATPTAAAEEVAQQQSGGGGGSVIFNRDSEDDSEEATEEDSEDSTEEATEEATEETEEEVTEETTEEEPAEIELPFGDTNGHWAEKFIKQLYKLGVVSGKSEAEFAPNAPITRAEFVKIAIEVVGIDVPTDLTRLDFTDVSETDWYAGYVLAAKTNGISSGYADGTFKPNAPITRAEALRILFDAAQLNVETNYDPGFPDVAEDAWFKQYVNFAASYGIVSGYSDGTFGPGNQLTRAETTKIVGELITNEKALQTIEDFSIRDLIIELAQ